MKKLVQFFLILIMLFPVSMADQFDADMEKLSKTQTWVGKNGKPVRGVFKKRDGDFIEIFVMKAQWPNNVIRVEIAHLRDDTRKWFLRAWETKEKFEKEKAEYAKQGIKISRNRGRLFKEKIESSIELQLGKILDLNQYPHFGSSGFKLVSAEKTNRRNVPNFDQADYGKKASDCVPNSYAMFVSWWHNSGWVKMPDSRKSSDKQIQWLHDELSSCMKTRNNSGTRVRDLDQYLQKFFHDEMKAQAAFTHRFDYDYRPENLAKYTRGANATVLYLTVYNGRRKQGGHAVTLKLAKPDGSVEFNTWGMSLTGKLKLIPDEETKSLALDRDMPSYEIELSVGTKLPDWFVDQDSRFVLEASEDDCISVLTPYLPDVVADK